MSTNPTDIAPHVDPAWVDAFVLELRLRDVPGDLVGDALAEVESHVLDAGTSADDAFGDPRAYAATIAETAARPTPDEPGAMVPPALGGAALVVAITGIVAWLGDGAVDVTGGTLAVVGAVLALPFVVQRYGTPVLRYLVESSFWRIWLLVTASGLLLAGVALVGRAWQVATVAAPALTVPALVVVAVAAVLGLRDASDVDPLLPPGADRATAEAAIRRDTRRLRLLTSTIQVGFVAGAVGFAVLLTRLTP
ncbi:hypothetical protein [Cellulomonas wangsupingiae]|uniref:hypothetical protein n=1 Tax=Cellulomonas wangsupingiae TaxID=2968085 RepID=UPI001D0ECE3E|nr:hypothetical protein [Cellulomonas wangsupingiae]MCM0639672.1 hypothetical protein [Cellulomonas wangsupingiae]